MTNAAEMQIVVELKDKASASLKNVDRSFSSTAAGITKGVAKMAAGFALLMGAAAIGGTIVVLKKSISAFIEFEDAMAGVAKTTGLSGEALKELGDDIRNLSKSVPVAAVELAEIAAIAGQLGIEGTDNIIAFTETVAQISVAFDMTAEKSAIAMAKLGNIYDLPIEQTSNLASAINTLGNSTAAFEREIITFMMSLGAGAKSLGFTSDEVAALGATLVGVGQDANDAGTRMNQAFTQMAKKVDVFAQYLGISDEEFRKAFGKAPMKMLISIVAKIKEIEDPLLQQAKAASLFGTIGAKAIKGLIGGFDDLSVNLENSATGFEENTSLAAEYAAKTSTLKAAIKILKNNLQDVAITIGTKLAPYVTLLVDKFVEFIPVLEETAANIWRDLEPALKKLWDKFKDIYPSIKEVGTELINRLKPAFDDLKSAFDSIIIIGSSLISGFSNNETAMGSLTAVINIAIDTFNWFAKAISEVLDLLAKHPVITAIVVGAILLMVAPILKIIAVIAILATAWNENWFGIKDTVLRIVGLIVDYLEWYFEHLEILWSKHGDTIMAAASLIWETIKTVVGIAIEGILLVINVFLDILEGDWSGAWARIKEYVSKTLDNLGVLFVSWKENILPLFAGAWHSMKQWVSDFADNTLTKIKTWVSNIIRDFVRFKDSIIRTIRNWYNTVVGYFDFSKIEVKWPSLTLPSISEPGYEKYDVHERALPPAPDTDPAPTPHYKYDRAGYDATAPPPHDKSTPHDESAPHYKYDRAGYDASAPSYKDGGPIPEDMNVDVHKGEYVVPKAGALVMGGSSPKDGHVQMTYNIGTVNGVDDLEKLLEKHDRDLYRRLVSLV